MKPAQTVMFGSIREHTRFMYNGYMWLKYSSTQGITHTLPGVYSFEQSALVTI